MKLTPERNHGSIHEGHRLRQPLHLFLQPVRMPCEESACIFNAPAIGKREIAARSVWLTFSENRLARCDRRSSTGASHISNAKNFRWFTGG